MARLLILHAAVGLGHRRAAEALGQAVAAHSAGPVWVEDTLAYGNPLFRRLYAGSYLELSRRAPALWAYYYERADEVAPEVTQRLRVLIDQLGISHLDELIARRQPDAVICTHFLPLDLLVEQRRRGKPVPPLFCVVTDFTGHVFWAYADVDGYFVATPQTAAMLAQRGVPANLITVTGIPVDAAIAQPKDRLAMRRAYDYGAGPVTLLLGSGIRAERVRRIVVGLFEQGVTGTLIVVAGRSAALVDCLKELPRGDTLDLRVLGFVDYLDDLVTASDLVITKAGGLIVSEVLARGRPLVVIDPIRGQEEWNADYVVSVGAGVQLRLEAMVPTVVANLLTHAAHRHLLEEGAARAGRPRAAFDVANAVLAALAGH